MNGKLTAMAVITIFFIILSAQPGYSKGPGNIAFSDRSLWPHEISSRNGFDIASRLEILAFLQALNRTSSEGFDYQAYLGIDNINMDSIQKFRAKIERIMFDNFRNASGNTGNRARSFYCYEVKTPESLLKYADAFDKELPDNLKPWYENARQFHSRYVYEQLRLAALFPRISSEILTFDASEITGCNLPDKTFLLTFDDGPSKINGTTDRLIRELRGKNVSALFFLLGEKLDSRLKKSSAEDLITLYQGMYPVSHGRQHKSHASWELWEDSVTATDTLLRDTFRIGADRMQFFRPPYGQRKNSAASSLSRHNIKIMLWNIDSQDWNRKISADNARDRVMTLMLLWRKGIILFHDIHDKAISAVPEIIDMTTKAGVVFRTP